MTTPELYAILVLAVISLLSFVVGLALGYGRATLFWARQLAARDEAHNRLCQALSDNQNAAENLKALDPSVCHNCRSSHSYFDPPSYARICEACGCTFAREEPTP